MTDSTHVTGATKWQTVQFRRLFEVVSGATPKSGVSDFWDGDIPWVTPADLGALDGRVVSNTKRRITEAGYESSGVTLVPAGSIVLSKRAPIGQVALLGIAACANQGCLLLKPRPVADAGFYYYWLDSKTAELNALGSGSTFMELSTDALKALSTPLPPLAEQRAIAADLNRETTRIDALLAAKTAFVERLGEKRRTLVSEAVTRGLDPAAPRRDSGVPWLGEIPAHWEVERGRWLFTERDDRSETGEEEMLTVSHLTGVTRRSEKDVNMFEAASTVGYKICQPGDLAINTLWAWMGAMGVSPHHGIVSPAYHVYTPSPRLDSAYVDVLVRTRHFVTEVTRYSKGVWSSRLRLYPAEFFNVLFPVPPILEQRAIVADIERQTRKIDAVVRATEASVALLRERRGALISATVTGRRRVSI